MDPLTEPAVRSLADIEAIRIVLTEYGRTLDAGDAAGYAALFVDEGEWYGGPYSAKTRDGIRAMAQRVIDGRTPGSTFVHVLTNMIVKPNGSVATAWSRWMLIVSGPDGNPLIRRTGTYEDSLVRGNDGWKFLRRTVSHDQELKAP